jgi:hypothetical protein
VIIRDLDRQLRAHVGQAVRPRTLPPEACERIGTPPEVVATSDIMRQRCDIGAKETGWEPSTSSLNG